MARPIKHEVSRLISEGRHDEAKVIVEGAIYSTGSVAKGAVALGASLAAMWRWVTKLDVATFYDGRAGAEARWSFEREKKKMIAGTRKRN